MTRHALIARLRAIEAELQRLTSAVEDALQPIRAEMLLGDLTRCGVRVTALIQALTDLEETP